jgi:hypothetical protein
MWIQVEQSLVTHRKTLRLAKLLHLDNYAVVGRLVALWCWALDNAEDGDLGDLAPDELAVVMGWMGDPDELLASLVASGFVQAQGGTYHIHDWEEYAGRLLDQRRANAAKQKAWRERHAPQTPPSPPTGNVTDTSPSPLPSRNGLPNHTIPNQIHTERETAASGAAAPEPRTHPSASVRAPIPAGKPPKARITPIRPPIHSPPVTADVLALDVHPPVTTTQSNGNGNGHHTPPRPISAPPPARSTNPIWDGLVTLLGYEPQTKTERSNWGGCVKQLKDVGATPEQIATRGAAYRDFYGADVALTPNALVKHWAELGVPRSPKVMRPSSNGTPEQVTHMAAIPRFVDAR